VFGYLEHMIQTDPRAGRVALRGLCHPDAGVRALRGGAARRVRLARLPLALCLRGRPSHHRGRAQPRLRGGGRYRRHLRAPAHSLGAREAAGHRAGTRPAPRSDQRLKVRLQRHGRPRVRYAESRRPQAQRDALCRGEDPGLRGYATAATERELDSLANLVSDVRAVAAVEREGFEVEAHRVPLRELLADAEVYASTLPWHHPIEIVVKGPRHGCSGACRP
jgi:hypothetical protein